MVRSSFPIALSLATLALIGCEVGGVDDGGPDPSGQPDAGAVERNCAVPEEHGALGALGGNAFTNQETTGTIWRLDADIDPVSPRDVFSLALWDGVGPFAGGVAGPGTYTLGGADANFATCGACVTIVADIVPMVGPTELYIAQSGTLQVDSVSPTFSGSLANVVLQEFDLSSGAPIPGGCTTHIASAEFSAVMP